MVRVKICGITNIADAEDAAYLGADALGFVFAESPRRISKEGARAIINELPPFVTCVGLFVDEEINKVADICGFCNIHAIQFHGNETQQYLDNFSNYKIIKAFRIRDKRDLLKINDFNADAYLLDSYTKGKMGGTGKSFNWELVNEAESCGVSREKIRKFIIAGGLNPENAAKAAQMTKPYGVDTSSGVEASPGIKDKNLIKAFINNVKTEA